MKQDQIKIGMVAVVKVGGRLARVTVLRELPTRYDRRRKFACLTHDTRREITATAARLRPAPGSPEDDASRSRAAAAAARRSRQEEPRAWTMPEGMAAALVDARPVPGMIARVGRMPVMALNETDRAGVDRLVDRLHCAEPAIEVCRRIRRGLARFQWQTIPATLRRAVMLAGLERHAANGQLYRATMGHAPLPSERMVADAVGVACGLGRCP